MNYVKNAQSRIRDGRSSSNHTKKSPQIERLSTVEHPEASSSYYATSCTEKILRKTMIVVPIKREWVFSHYQLLRDNLMYSGGLDFLFSFEHFE